MLTRGVSWRDPTGKPVRLIGSSIDITELKQTEEMLRRNQSLLAEAQEIEHIGCWSWDIRSGRLDWSDELYRVFGLDWDRQSPDHEGFMAGLQPDDRSPISELIDAACRGTKTYNCEYRVILEKFQGLQDIERAARRDPPHQDGLPRLAALAR